MAYEKTRAETTLYRSTDSCHGFHGRVFRKWSCIGRRDNKNGTAVGETVRGWIHDVKGGRGNMGTLPE